MSSARPPLSRRRFLGALAAVTAGCRFPAVEHAARCYNGTDADPLCREQLWSYNSRQTSFSTVFRPSTVSELRAVLQNSFSHSSRRLSVRGGGAALDSQSLNRDSVIKLDRPEFTFVQVNGQNTATPTVRVGAGATWARVLAETLPFGLVPYCMPSSSIIRVGGSLAANAMSRVAPRWGREERYLRSFKLMTMDGALHDCSEDSTGLDRRLFAAVPGSMGYLGVVTEATYPLRRLANPGVRLAMQTDYEFRQIGEGGTAEFRANVESLLHELVNVSRALPGPGASEEAGVEGAPQALDTVFGTLFWVRDQVRSMRSILARGAYVRQTSLDPPRNILNQRTGFLRVFGEYGFIEPGNEASIQDIFSLTAGSTDRSVDPVDDFTFFQDADLRAKYLVEDRWRMVIDEQAYGIPIDLAATFIEVLDQIVRRDYHFPALVDLLYVPRDRFHEGAARHPFSATADGPVLVVTVAFLDRNGEQWACSSSIYRELARHCASMNGRVYLAKTVEAAPDDLALMWRDPGRPLAALKQEVDPNGVLTNEFWDRNLAGLWS